MKDGVERLEIGFAPSAVDARAHVGAVVRLVDEANRSAALGDARSSEGCCCAVRVLLCIASESSAARAVETVALAVEWRARSAALVGVELHSVLTPGNFARLLPALRRARAARPPLFVAVRLTGDAAARGAVLSAAEAAELDAVLRFAPDRFARVPGGAPGALLGAPPGVRAARGALLPSTPWRGRRFYAAAQMAAFVRAIERLKSCAFVLRDARSPDARRIVADAPTRRADWSHICAIVPLDSTVGAVRSALGAEGAVELDRVDVEGPPSSSPPGARRQRGGGRHRTATIGRSFRRTLRCGGLVLSDDSARLFDLAPLDRERVALSSILACHKALWTISTFLR